MCLFLSFVAVPTSCLKLYEELCSEARRYAPDCKNLLQNDYKIVAATNYHDLAKLILILSAFEAQSYQDYLIQEVPKYPSDPALRLCAFKLIKSTVDAFRSSLSGVDKNPKSARSDAQTASLGAADCDRAIQNETPNFDPLPIRTRNNEMLILSVVCSLAINHLI